MRSLDQFEQRLEGAVDGLFARLMRSRVHPVELAEAVRRYATTHTHVTTNGLTAPNVFRVRVSAKDYAAFAAFGASLARELAAVVAEACAHERYVLLGPVRVRVVRDESLRVGQFRMVGRHEAVAATSANTSAWPLDLAVETARETAHASPPAHDDLTVTQVLTQTPASMYTLRVIATGDTMPLHANRYTIGRANTCDIMLNDASVSREHAAIVRRAERFWVVDLGSLNGTFVNDRQTAEHPLNPGDKLRLGEALIDVLGV